MDISPFFAKNSLLLGSKQSRPYRLKTAQKPHFRFPPRPTLNDPTFSIRFPTPYLYIRQKTKIFLSVASQTDTSIPFFIANLSFAINTFTNIYKSTK